MTTIHTRQLQYTQDNYNNTHKTTTTIHTRQLQQYTQDNYNNTHKTTATIHTRQLQQYTQDNYNNTHNTTTTIHTTQLQKYTQHNHNNTQHNHNNTHNTSHNTTCTNGKQHHSHKVLYTVSSIFPHTYCTHTFTPALHFSPYSHSPTRNSKLVTKFYVETFALLRCYKKNEDLLCPAADPRSNSKFHAALDASNSKPEIFVSKFHPKCDRHYVGTKLPPLSSKDLTPLLPSVHNHSTCTSSHFTSLTSKSFASMKIFSRGTGSLWLGIFRVENLATAPTHYSPYSCPV